VKFIGRSFDWTVFWKLISTGVSDFWFFWILTRVFTEFGMSFFIKMPLSFFLFSLWLNQRVYEIWPRIGWQYETRVIVKVWRYLISVLWFRKKNPPTKLNWSWCSLSFFKFLLEFIWILPSFEFFHDVQETLSLVYVQYMHSSVFIFCALC